MNPTTKKVYRIGLAWFVIAALLATGLAIFANGASTPVGNDRESRTLNGAKLAADTAVLTLAQHPTTDTSWSGTLTSNDPDCIAGRTINLLRDGVSVGTTTTSSTGTYSFTGITDPNGNQDFQATAPAANNAYAEGGVCSRADSNTVRT